MTRTLYEILDVHEEASQADIRRAYRALALRHHPDKQGADSTSSTDEFTALQHAYEILRNERSRSAYNAELERDRRRREQGLPPEKSSFTQTANYDSDLSFGPEEAYSFGILGAAALLFQHVLLMCFGWKAVFLLNFLLAVACGVAACLMESVLIPLLGALGIFLPQLTYFVLWFLFTKLLKMQITVPFIACFAWSASTLVAWTRGLSRQIALFNCASLVVTQIGVVYLPWYEEIPLFACAVFMLLRLDNVDRAGDTIAFFAVLKTLNNLWNIWRLTRWLFSSLFRIVSWLGSIYVVFAIIRFAYIKAGRPMWAQRTLHAIDEMAFVLCEKVLPTNLMREAKRANARGRGAEQDGDEAAASSNAGGSKRRKKKRKMAKGD